MRRLADAVPRLFLLFALFSCTSDSTGPHSVQRAQFSLAPGFDRAVLAQVGIDRALVRFTRTDGSKALETIVSFPAGSDTLNVAVAVPLNSAAESFQLTLLLIDDPAGDTVFRSGPTPVVLKSGVSQPTVSAPPFLYSGHGANATGVRFVAKPATVAFGQTATFTAEAFDAAGVTIPNTPIIWSTSDAAKASLPDGALGAVVGGTTRGSVTVTASLLQTVPDTPPPSVGTTLVVQPVASILLAQGGAGQSGAVGAVLAQPLRVRVNAADNLGVQGVPVSFAVTSGGGSLSASQALTDVNGDATVLWTLGGTMGVQAVSATLTGVTGVTQTFSATGVAGAASKLVFTTQPSAANAGVAIAPAVVIEAQDSFGNTATTFTGPIAVALGNGPAGASVGGTTSVAAVNGVARFTDLSVSKVGTGATLVASSTGLAGATSAAFTVSSGAAATLAFTAQPSNATAGSAIAPSIIVTARDAGGNTATSFTGAVTLSLGTNPGGGTLSGTTTVNAVAGVATFPGITLAKAATGYTVTATATGLTNATSGAFTVTPAAASVLAFTTPPSAVNAGAAIAPAVVVEAQDSFGNTATSFTGAVSVAFGTSPAGATLGGATTVSAINGVARFVDLAISTAGTGITLAATSTGLAGATSAAFLVSAGAPATLVFTTQPSNATAAAAIAPSIVITARDARGNTATSFAGAVSLTLGANPGGATLTGTTTINAVNGVATFSGVALAKAAAGYTLTAAASGLGSATSGTFTIAPAAATLLAFTTQPATSGAAAVIAPAVGVSALDAFGNVVTAFTGNVVIAIGTNPGGASLAGTTTVAAVNGAATFNDLSLSTRGTGYTLTATATGLTGATSAAFDIAASTLAFTGQPSNATAGVAIAPSIVVTARDANGNTATGFAGAVSLSLAVNPGGGALSGATTVNAVNGVATFPGVTVAKSAAGYALLATATGMGGATSGTFTIAPAAASALAFTTQPSPVNAGAAIAPAVVVEARDSFGNIAAAFTGSITMAFGTSPSGATLGGTTTITAVNGVARFADLSVSTAGAGVTLAATSNGLTGATSAAFTVSAGTAATLAFTAQPSNAAAGSAITPSIVVTARDASGNTATSFTGGVTLAFGANPGGGTLSGTTTVTAVNGVATFAGVTVAKAAAGYTLTASATGLTTATSAAFAISPAAASLLAFTTQPSSVNAGAAIAPAVVVEAQDAFGNTANGFTGAITMALGNAPAGATLGGSVTVNAVNGVARFADLSVSTPGTGITLAAGSSGLTSATSTGFAVSAGAPATLVFTTQPSSATAGSAIAPSIVVTARDAGGNTASSFAGAVSLALGANPGGGALSGTTTVNAVNGVATFSGVTLAKAGGGYTLNAAATGLGSATSGTFTIAPAAASVLAFSAQPTTTGAGATIAPPVGVSALDAFGNIATAFSGNVVITIGANPGGASLSGTTTVAAVAGVASFSNLALTARGTGYTLVASGTGLTSATSATFDIAATTLAWTNPSGGLWSTPSNWSLGRVPQGADSIVIAQPGTYTVTLDTTFTGAVLTLGGGSGTQTLLLSSRTLTISGTMTVKPNGAFTAVTSTVAGAGSVVNQGTLNLKSTNITTAGGLDNQSTVIANAAVNVSGPVTTAAGSTLRLLADGTTGFSTFTSANSFTNNGAIELTTTTSAYSPTLAVSGGGTLTNAAGGTITTLVGAGGPRTIDAQIVNQGTITIAQPLTLAHVSAVHTNGGTIDASAADFTINQSGTAPSFTNSGTVTIGSGHTWSVNGGALNQNVGTIGGAGTLALTNLTANFASNITNATTGFVATNVTMNGPGTLINASGQTMSLKTVIIDATSGLDNRGTLIVNAAVTVNGALTTGAGSTLRILADGTTGFSTFTSGNSFTNNGAIELTTTTSAYSPTLAVAGSGTLTNAASGTITALVGAGGPRTIDAQIANLGTITLAQPLTLAHTSAAHTNGGTIDASAADFTLNQGGTAPSFTNTGSVTIGTGHSWTVNGGTLNQNAGIIGGAGTLSLNNLTANFAANVTNATTGFSATGVAINGPGTLTNASGQTMSLKTVTFGATSGLINQGTLIVNAAVTVNGALTTSPGSTLRILADGSTGFSTFTSANSFTNNGAIELTTTTSSYSPTLAVAGSNTLTNAAGGTITTLVGAGGPRTIDAQVVNQGTITLAQPLTLAHPSAAHTNSGTIDASTADFTLNQGGTTPSFTNSGTMTIGAGHSLTVNGGTLNQNAGTLAGAGTLALNNVTANFVTNVTNATTGFVATNVTFNGPGTLTNASGQTMSLKTVTIGATSGLINQGTLIANAAVNVNGPFTASAGSALRILADGSTGFSTFTSANSFTNNGAIELTTTTSAYSPTLAVSGSNTLTNAAGGTITSLVGAGGPRTIDAQLVNGGSIIIQQPLTLTHASAAHTNNGTIDASGGSLTVNQTGTAPTFVNSSSGTISIGAGQVLAINGGTFTQAGNMNGSGGVSLTNATTSFNSLVTVGSLDVSGGSVGFASNQNTGGLATTLNSTTVNGPGSITNSAGQTLSIRGVTFNTTLTNQGTLITDGSSSVSAGTFSNAAGSTLRLLATGSTGNSTFTVPSFTNLGAIELSTTVAAYSTTLAVSGATGTLINGSTGSISSLVGTGGTRTINAQLVNQGLLTINQPLVLNRPISAHSNAGTIDATNADLTVNQTGSPASFDNTGSLTVGAGHLLRLTGGTFTTDTLRGGGALFLNGTAATFRKPFTLATLNVSGGSLSFTGSQTTSGVSMTLGNTTVSAPSFTNSAGQTLDVNGVIFNTNLTNQGTMYTDGASAVTGANSIFSNAAGSRLVLLATGATGNSTLTVPSFTNAGAIELTTTVAAYTTNLTVAGTGFLTNASTGTISSLVGTGGTRTISAQLVNQGLVTIDQPLVLNRIASAHSNPGTIDATNADLTVNQSGSPASFDNSGGLTVGTGHTFSITGGSFSTGTLNGGGSLSLNGTTSTFNKPFSLPTLNVTGGALTFTGSQTTTGITMNLVSTTVNSSAGFSNSAGQTLNARAVTFNTILQNQGTLIITDGVTSVTGPNSFFSNAAGALLRIQANGALTGNATFSTPNSFANSGAIEMTTVTAAYQDVLTVGGGTGTLTNNLGATITTLPGAGGSRTINGTLDNSGTITLHPGPSPAGTLQVNGAFNHRAGGVLNLEIAGPAASTDYSRMSVSGAAFLFQATLNYSLLNGYTPAKGTPFDILTAGSVGGSFSVGTQPGGWANPTYLPAGAPATLVRLTAP